MCADIGTICNNTTIMHEVLLYSRSYYFLAKVLVYSVTISEEVVLLSTYIQNIYTTTTSM